MKQFLGCLVCCVAFIAAGFFFLMWAAQGAQYEETHGWSLVTSPDGKHQALIRSGEEYFHDSVVLDDQTVALSRTFRIADLRWKNPQTLVVRYLPSGLPNVTGGPVSFDQQARNVGNVRIDYVRISQAELDKETHKEEENRKRRARMQKPQKPAATNVSTPRR